MTVDIHKISFKEVLEIIDNLKINISKIHKEEQSKYSYNLPRLNSYEFSRLEEEIKKGLLNDKNFRESYMMERIVDQWNNEPYGRDYPTLLKRYKKLANDPKSIETLKGVWENGGRSWGWIWKETSNAVSEGRFISFWLFTISYNDTKGTWRHWWDTLRSEKKFSIGDIVELRSKATPNNIFYEYVHGSDDKYRYLKSIRRLDFKTIKSKAFMVIAYDQKKPQRTYSYKKGQGSHRLITVLPIGSTKMYYVPEQFIKISRRQAVKDAKGKKK